jgi:hypothetical protein
MASGDADGSLALSRPGGVVAGSAVTARRGRNLVGAPLGRNLVGAPLVRNLVGAPLGRLGPSRVTVPLGLSLVQKLPSPLNALAGAAQRRSCAHLAALAASAHARAQERVLTT